MSTDNENGPSFEWVKLKAELDAPHAASSESSKDKFVRKMKSNPFVPVGCLLTAGVLTYGLICFRKGDTKTSQLMMRFRVGAQGLTVVALLGGILYSAVKPPQKN